MKNIIAMALCLLFFFSCTQKEELKSTKESMSTHDLMNDVVDRLLAGNYEMEQMKKDLNLLEEKALVQEKPLAETAAAARAGVCDNQTLRGRLAVRTGGGNQVNTAGFNVRVTSQGGATYVNTITNAESPYNYCNSIAVTGTNTVCMSLSDSDGIYEDSDWINGVSTLDLVYISRHILRIATFTYGEQLLASDVNRDGGIDYDDVDDLRDMILGITLGIANLSTVPMIANQGDQPWLIIPELSVDEETFVLNNYPEVLDDQETLITSQGRDCFTSLYVSGTLTPNSRVAVKVGDVNFSANLSNLAD